MTFDRACCTAADTAGARLSQCAAGGRARNHGPHDERAAAAAVARPARPGAPAGGAGRSCGPTWPPADRWPRVRVRVTWTDSLGALHVAAGVVERHGAALRHAWAEPCVRLVLLALCASAGHPWSTQGSSKCADARLLLRPPAVRRRVRSELRCLTRRVLFPAGAALESMPYTDAVIREGMRVHPIIMSLFRRTAQVRRWAQWGGMTLCDLP